MARKKMIEEQELMMATEELLLEKGYEGFHFKALSEKLGTARSTIYEYYPNKDELITSYMKKSIEMIIKKVIDLQQNDSAKEQLRKLLGIFITYSHIHRLLQIIHQLKTANSENIQMQIENLNHDHHKLFSLIIGIVKKAQAEKCVRPDLSPQVVATVFFTSIQIPKVLEIDLEEWSEYLFSIIFDGIKL